MKTFKRLILFLSVIGLLGGCSMTSKEVILTKEQQDNVVRWIARGYEVESVEFMNIERDGSTGMYLLSFQLNGNKHLRTTISIKEISEFDEPKEILSLNPISRFKSLKKAIPIQKYDSIDIIAIKIRYLGD